MDTRIIPWPAFILALALTFAGFTWWSLTRAASNVSAVTDANYYSHGLAYNSMNRELLAAETLGWQINPRVDGRRLTIQVRNRDQSGVSGCNGSITVQPAAGDKSSFPLIDAGQGQYTVMLPADLPSTVTASLTMSNGQATLQRQLLIALDR